MASSQLQILLAGRAACRALLSASSITSEAPCAWTAALSQSRFCQTTASCDDALDAAAPSSSGSSHQSALPYQLSRGPSRRAQAALPSSATQLLATRAFPLGTAPAFRLLHSSGGPSASASAAAEGEQGAGREQQQQAQQSQPTGSSAPVRNAMAAALEAALSPQAGGESGGLAEVSAAAAAVGGGRRPRTWMWYDPRDEREERAKERRRNQYERAGMSHLLDAPQSMKKMNRIVRLVRGLSYSEAAAQCRLVPHKAATFVLQALERAYENATEEKGLDGEKLVVSTIYVTKGVYEKGIQPMGKGGAGAMVKRKSHLRVVLTESRGPASFSPRVVPPLMAAWTGASARWLAAAGREGQGQAAPRQRFAYRLEV